MSDFLWNSSLHPRSILLFLYLYICPHNAICKPFNAYPGSGLVGFITNSLQICFPIKFDLTLIQDLLKLNLNNYESWVEPAILIISALSRRINAQTNDLISKSFHSTKIQNHLQKCPKFFGIFRFFIKKNL